uniref:Uncharacterized protein n=1 Tax=Cannabis sativa TaxID=3483 RepID=A0A803QS49_CANSA
MERTMRGSRRSGEVEEQRRSGDPSLLRRERKRLDPPLTGSTMRQSAAELVW